MRRKLWLAALAVPMCSVLAWSALAGAAPARHRTAKLDKVTLQLKWVTQAQFAGYYAAKAKGYYRQFGLDVTIKPGGPSITPEQVVASGQAEFGLDWLPSLLATRDTGTNLVNIAQVFTRSGMTELTWKDSGINSIAKMRGKVVGVWCCGNQYELYAALTKNGIDPTNKSDVTIFNQPFDMKAFLDRKIDAAAAMTYNELAQVLEAQNPKTGKLYKLGDLNVFKLENVGTGMLEDGVFVRGDWLKGKGHRDIAMRFLAASFRGWIYCRDHFADCVNTVLKQGPTLLGGHQRWQMNEINALIWPTPNGIGVMNHRAYLRTVAIAKTYKVIKKTPNEYATYDHTLAKAGLTYLRNKVKGVDVFGRKWHKATVKVTPGGK